MLPQRVVTLLNVAARYMEMLASDPPAQQDQVQELAVEFMTNVKVVLPRELCH